MGRPPKDIGPVEPTQTLPELVATNREAKAWLHRVLHPDEVPNWDDYRARVLAWQRIGAIFATNKDVREAIKAQAQLFRSEKDGLVQWYEHERVEKLEKLVEQLGATLWEVLSPFIPEEHQDTARAALDAATAKLGGK